ncbi:hypothetical protein TanjilG_08761 [Lupinus angustifolius]|uniref:Uncharacterized protein n=1 Tax=Lupinus angustifolius TaxID=3871 RepID=A0A1J7GUR7_LUPAN|nr:hypothetical protein TanjilG_08761 [Lupinus angustifolius]
MAKKLCAVNVLFPILAMALVIQVAYGGGERSLRQEGTYGNKEECPCYNNWKTKEGAPKCP